MHRMTSKQMEKIKKYPLWADVVKQDFRKDPAQAYVYLKAVLKEYEESGDERHLLLALRRVAEAVGVANLAKKTGLSRQSIYKALSENGNPTLKTLDAVLRALGFTHSFRPI
jgi:probable addiction module antidote protein